MKSVLYFAALACISITAQAQEYYVGASVGPSYNGTANFVSGGQTITMDGSRAIPIKASVGVDINTNLGFEAGYKTFGTTRTDMGNAAGTALDTDARAFYLAAKGTLPLGEKWALTGKLGLAQRHFGITLASSGQSLSDSTDQSTLYAGVGVAYKITNKVALTAELEHFGEAQVQRYKLGMDGFTVGVRFGF